MMKMKNVAIIFLFLLMIAVNFSCTKGDCNGYLDGTWQLVEWRDTGDSVKATKENEIYYSFQLSMIKLQRLDCTPARSKMASFERYGDSLRVCRPLTNLGGGHEKYSPIKELADYGIPADSSFLVKVLTSDALILSSNKSGTLVFRKY